MSQDTASQNEVSQNTTIKNFVNIIAAPAEAFANLKVNSNILFPLLLILCVQALVMIFYFQKIDFDWYVDMTVEYQMQAMERFSSNPLPEDVEERIRQSMLDSGPTTTMLWGTVASVVSLVIMFLIYGGYLRLVSAITANGIRFGQWFAFLWWSSVPLLFGMIASIINIGLNSTGQIRDDQINPLSLNNLIFSLDRGEPYFALLSRVDLTFLWATALLVVGYRIWTKANWLAAILVPLAPVLVIIGIVAAVSG